MGRFHITTKTTHHSDPEVEDDGQDAVASPAWATHNPPRPARNTLTPHAGGANPFLLQSRTRSASHKQTTQDSPRDAIGSAVGERAVYQVVVDKVGHGVAPDQPVLLPEPAPVEVTSSALSFAAVESAGGAKDVDMQAAARREWEWKHGDSTELALVGAAVLVVAAIVMVIARRQQRAYDRQQEQQLQAQQLAATQSGETAQSSTGSADLENGAPRLDTSRIRSTRDDDEVGTPASEDEGIV